MDLMDDGWGSVRHHNIGSNIYNTANKTRRAMQSYNVWSGVRNSIIECYPDTGIEERAKIIHNYMETLHLWI